MSAVIATRAHDGLRLEVDVDSSLIVGPNGRIAVPQREALFAYLLFSSSPAILRYEKIEAEILRPHGIGIPPSDPMTYIRKLKLAADRNIQDASGEVNLISAVRGMGYRLEGDWAVRNTRREIDYRAFAATLIELAKELVSEMQNTPLKDVGDGILVLDFAADGDASALDRFHSWSRVAVKSVESSAPAVFLSAFESMLADVESYFSFRRQGAVDEGVWRELFERELLTKVTILCQLLIDSSTATRTSEIA